MLIQVFLSAIMEPIVADSGEEAEEHTSSLSVVVLGPSSAGKSTVAGHLGLKLGAFSEEQAQLAEEEASSAGVPDKKYAWLLDKTVEVKTAFFFFSFFLNLCFC